MGFISTFSMKKKNETSKIVDKKKNKQITKQMWEQTFFSVEKQ